MLNRDDILYTIAHIGNKRIEYGLIKEFITLPGTEDWEQVEFIIAITNNGSGMDLIFNTHNGYVTYYRNPADIMETLYKGTGTEHVILGDTAFEVEEFNFEVVKMAGGIIEYA